MCVFPHAKMRFIMCNRLKIATNISFITLFVCSTNTIADASLTARVAPNLQGVWTAATVTPLERPETLNDKPSLSSA